MILQLLTLAAAADASSAAHGAADAIRGSRSNGLGSILIPINELDYKDVSVGFWSLPRYEEVTVKYLIPSSKIASVKEVTPSYFSENGGYLGRIYINTDNNQKLVYIKTYDDEEYVVKGSLEDFQNYLISLVQKPKRKSKKKKK